jgi:hypothetical protein
MIIYNVTIKVDNSIVNDWLKWMKEEHLADVVSTGCFFDSRLCHLLEQDEKEGKTYVAQYFCENMEQYNTYISEHAQKMRDKGFKRFGNKFIAFRTLMRTEN